MYYGMKMHIKVSLTLLLTSPFGPHGHISNRNKNHLEKQKKDVLFKIVSSGVWTQDLLKYGALIPWQETTLSKSLRWWVGG